jgi:hypothetical protein
LRNRFITRRFIQQIFNRLITICICGRFYCDILTYFIYQFYVNGLSNKPKNVVRSIMTPSILRNSKRHIPLSILKVNCPSHNLCCKHQCRRNPETMQTGCQSENNSTIWKWGNPIGQDKMDHPLEIIKSTDTVVKLMENGLNLKKIVWTFRQTSFCPQYQISKHAGGLFPPKQTYHDDVLNNLCIEIKFV